MTPLAVLMPSLTIQGNAVSCSVADFRKALYLALQFVPFDEEWYLVTYPDVKKAVTSGLIASGREHFRVSGYLEGRFPTKPPVDEDWYLREYPDVRASVAKGEINNAYDHFVRTGAREGRLPCRMAVDAQWYQQSYPAAGQRIRRKESLDAEDDFHRHGYRSGWFPTQPRLLTSPRVRKVDEPI